jgi:hypothetical protein
MKTVVLTVLAAVVLAAPVAAQEPIPDGPEPWLYAVAVPPAEEVGNALPTSTMVESAESHVGSDSPPEIDQIHAESDQGPAAMWAPTVVVTADTTGRDLARTLPVSTLPVHVFTYSGVAFDRGHVVAWYVDDTGDHFVMERGDGTRTVIVGNGRPGGPYGYPLGMCAAGADYDAFGVCP